MALGPSPAAAHQGASERQRAPPAAPCAAATGGLYLHQPPVGGRGQRHPRHRLTSRPSNRSRSPPISAVCWCRTVQQPFAAAPEGVYDAWTVYLSPPPRRRQRGQSRPAPDRGPGQRLGADRVDRIGQPWAQDNNQVSGQVHTDKARDVIQTFFPSGFATWHRPFTGSSPSRRTGRTCLAPARPTIRTSASMAPLPAVAPVAWSRAVRHSQRGQADRGYRLSDWQRRGSRPVDSFLGSEAGERPAVVLLSGGLDSATALAICVRGVPRPYALSFDYGQRHQVETPPPRRWPAPLGASRHVVVNFDLRQFGGSALTSDMPCPTMSVPTR